MNALQANNAYSLTPLTLPIEEEVGQTATSMYAGIRYENAQKVQLGNVYFYGIPCTAVLAGSNLALIDPAGHFVIQESGLYGLNGHVHLVCPNKDTAVECFYYKNGDRQQRLNLVQPVPVANGGTYYATEGNGADVYLSAGETVHLGMSDSDAGATYPRIDAPANSCTMTIYRIW